MLLCPPVKLGQLSSEGGTANSFILGPQMKLKLTQAGGEKPA